MSITRISAVTLLASLLAFGTVEKLNAQEYKFQGVLDYAQEKQPVHPSLFGKESVLVRIDPTEVTGIGTRLTLTWSVRGDEVPQLLARYKSLAYVSIDVKERVAITLLPREDSTSGHERAYGVLRNGGGMTRTWHGFGTWILSGLRPGG